METINTALFEFWSVESINHVINSHQLFCMPIFLLFL